MKELQKKLEDAKHKLSGYQVLLTFECRELISLLNNKSALHIDRETNRHSLLRVPYIDIYNLFVIYH